MLPFVYLNVATTADGKLAPANRKFVAFSSQRDQDLLLELRARADAVMAGARTVDLVPVNLGPGPAKYRRLRNTRVVTRITSTGGSRTHSSASFHRRTASIPAMRVLPKSRPKA